MKNRIKQILDTLHLSQKAFGQSLGYAQSTVGRWISGARPIQDRHIAAICKVHNVSERWLRTGEGEMFNLPKAGMTAEERLKQIEEQYKAGVLALIGDQSAKSDGTIEKSDDTIETATHSGVFIIHPSYSRAELAIEIMKQMIKREKEKTDETGDGPD